MTTKEFIDIATPYARVIAERLGLSLATVLAMMLGGFKEEERV